jgi:mannosyltransferase
VIGSRRFPACVLRSGVSAGAVVAALASGAAILRFSSLGTQSFWSDEAVTDILMRMPFTDMLHAIRATESTPPLYYVLAYGWTRACGTSEIGLRSLSALIGTLTVPAAYLAGRELVSRRAGLYAAVIVATHPLMVWYSQEARSYALLVLMTALVLAFFGRAWNRADGLSIVCWAAASLLAFGTHYFAAAVIAPTAILLFVRRPQARLGVLALVLLTLPLDWLALEQRRNATAVWIGQIGLGSRVQNMTKQFLVGTAAPRDQLCAAAVALAVLAAAVVAFRRTPDRRTDATVVGIAAAAVVIPLAFAAAGVDFFITKNMLPAFVPLVVAAATVFARAPRTLSVLLMGGVAVVFVSLVVAVSVEPRYQRGDWRDALHAAASPHRHQVLVVAPDFQGWFARVPIRIYLGDAVWIDGRGEPPLEQFRPLVGWSGVRRPRTILTAEVDEVSMGGPRPARIILTSHLRGFRRIATVRGATYAIVRWRSPIPRRIDPSTLARPASEGEPAAVIALRRRSP